MCLETQKTYDSVPLVKLWQVLEDEEVSSMYVQGQLYSNMTSRLRVDKQLPEPMAVTKGLK